MELSSSLILVVIIETGPSNDSRLNEGVFSRWDTCLVRVHKSHMHPCPRVLKVVAEV